MKRKKIECLFPFVRYTVLCSRYFSLFSVFKATLRVNLRAMQHHLFLGSECIACVSHLHLCNLTLMSRPKRIYIGCFAASILLFVLLLKLSAAFILPILSFRNPNYGNSQHSETFPGRHLTEAIYTAREYFNAKCYCNIFDISWPS
jgi:hypothetical protein